MNQDLFIVYLRNHTTSFINYIIMLSIFIWAKIYFYGLPSPVNMLVECLFIFLAMTTLLVQERYYKKLLSKHSLSEDDVRDGVFMSVILRVCFLIPWMLYVFWPVPAASFEYQVVGYLFVFIAVAAYSISSASYYILFVIEVLICIVFALVMTGITANDAQATKVLMTFLILLGAYAIALAQKANTSSRSLIARRIQLETAMQRLHKTNQAKSDFLAFMSHELRTPMTGILGMVNLLRETELNDKQIGYVDTIIGCSGTLLNTLNDGIDMVKVETGNLKIKKENFNYSDLIHNSANIVRPLVEQKNLKLNVRINEPVPTVGYGDRNRIQQILINLLNNAIKFTKQGSVTLMLSYIEGATPHMRFEVIDTGIGVSQEDQKKLFKKFSQIESGNSEFFSGAGLGLSICRNLAHLMGGNISLSSHPGEGTTITVDLPHMPPVITSPKSVHTRSNVPVSVKVMVVEDNPVNILVARSNLEKSGHNVIVAETGREALHILAETAPDIIMMDINLPDMTGFEVLKEIQNMEGVFSSIPVIALTANASDDVIRRGKNAGMADFIFKPYTRERLDEVINAQLGNIRPDARVKEYKNGKIHVLMEEFGPDYAKMFVDTSLIELNALITSVNDALHDRDLKKCAKLSHDIVSVAGAIGMEEVMGIARLIDQNGERDGYERVRSLFTRMRDAADRDAALLEANLNQLSQAF